LPYHVENLLGVPIGVNGCAIKTACYLCKEEATAIPDAQGLIAAAAVARIMLPTKLNGPEIKFLRKTIKLSSKNFAKIMGIRPETVSRWEGDSEQQIGYAEEKIFRILVGNKLKKEPHDDKAPAIDYDHMAIVEMVINPIRQSGNAPLVKFARIRMKLNNRKAQDFWEAL
jgi:DNA-binding transcriptional regulator YiaG